MAALREELLMTNIQWNHNATIVVYVQKQLDCLWSKIKNSLKWKGNNVVQQEIPWKDNKYVTYIDWTTGYSLSILACAYTFPWQLIQQKEQ